MNKDLQTYEEKMIEEMGREPKEGYKFVRNLMSQKICEIKINTPNCCDPSTETYHCM